VWEQCFCFAFYYNPFTIFSGRCPLCTARIAAAIMRQAEQRIFRCDRFRRNGVQSGSGDLAAAQGFGKGGAGHKVAAGSVDDENAPSFMPARKPASTMFTV